jgi:hypothetical protein
MALLGLWCSSLLGFEGGSDFVRSGGLVHGSDMRGIRLGLMLHADFTYQHEQLFPICHSL